MNAQTPTTSPARARGLRSPSMLSRLIPAALAFGLIFGPPITGCGKADNAAASQPGDKKSADGVAKPASAPKALDGNEWSSWRGPANTGVSLATGLPEKWTDTEDPTIWMNPDLGGRSTPIVMNDRVYVIRSTVRTPPWEMSMEEVACADAATGKIIWRYPFPLFHTDIPQDRVGWASLTGDPETGNIYAHGVQGMFYAFDKDGKVLWEKSLTEQFGRISGYGGRTQNPIVDQDLVIISFLNSSMGPHGKGLHRYLAMDKRTGEIRWWAAPGEDPQDTTYSAPAVTVVDGVRMLVAANADGNVYGLKIATGEKIWTFKLSKRGLNSSIVVDGKYVYAGHSEENIDNASLGRLVCIDASGKGDITKTNEVWRYDNFEAGYSSPVLHDGRVYSLSNSSVLAAVDAKSGKVYGEKKLGRAAKASPVWADGKIYYGDEAGNFYIVKPGDAGCEILSKKAFKDKDGFAADIKSGVAIAYGHLFFMSRDGLYCAGDPKNKPAPISIPALADAGAADPTPASLLSVPAEAHIAKDGEVKLAAFTYDAKGRLIGDAKPAWTLENLKGTISPEGVFVPDPSMNGQFGMVNAELNGLKAQTRVRVLPTLPYSQDFEKVPDGLTPSFWIGASKVKFATVAKDGNKVLVKNTDPKFQRANVYIGPPEMTGYTIQTDAFVGEGGELPDMGVINSRYIFDVMGGYKQLRLIGWVPMPRVTKTMPFELQRGKWYTLKCRVDQAGDKANVRGKIWLRDEPEPAAWTIEMEDHQPYRNGSPGLACFSPSEIWFDNVKVVKSE